MPIQVVGMRMPVPSVVLAIAVFAAAWLSPALLAPAYIVSPIWLADAVAIGLIVRQPQLRLRFALPVCFAAIALAALVSSASGVAALAMPIANLAEIAAICWLMRRYDVQVLEPIGLGRFVAIALTVSIGCALSVASVLYGLTPAPFTMVLRTWFTAHLLGLLIVVPPLAAINLTDLGVLKRLDGVARATACALLTALITLGVFEQQPYPLLFLVLPCIVLSTYFLGYIGAAIGNAVVVALALWLTGKGYGPIAYRLSDPCEQTLLLQLFLGVNALVSFPIAAVLAQRRQLVAALTDQERRARELLENVPIAILRVRTDGIVAYANPGFAALTGFPAGDVVGRSIDQVIRADTRIIDRFSQGIAGDRALRADVALPKRQDGELIAELTATPRIDARGEIIDWIALLFDVNEQRQAQSRLETSERLHRLLAENSHDMVVRIGIDGVRRYVSPASQRLLGYSPEELLDATPIAAIHADDRARVADTVRSLLDGVVDPVATYRQRHRAGHYVWLEAVYRLVLDPATGKPEEFIASVRDVSRRHAAERTSTEIAGQLLESNRLLTMAESLAHVGHFHLDTVHDTLFWSSEVYAIHGLPLDHPVSVDTAIDAYHPDDRERVSGIVHQALATGQGYEIIARIIRIDGDARWVVAIGQTELAPNGDVVGLFGVFQDITDRIETEQALIRAREQAEAALAARMVFTSTISHEIRTPLTGVLAAADLLRDATAPEEQSRHLAALHHSAELLSSIINDVLVFSKLEEQQVVPESISFDLIELGRDIVAAFRASADARGLAISLSTREAAVPVLGDPARIQRVLANLIANAIKFTPDGSVTLGITVIDLEHAIDVTLSVRDTGIGIACEKLVTIFDPFTQADASTTRIYGGTGLGLAICRMLVEAMNGSIVVESDEHGSEFKVGLMLPRGTPSAPANVALPAVPAQPLEILIAEDNATNRYLITALLEKLGHRITATAHGKAALDIIAARPATAFDLILMDIQMPVMDGIDTTRAIRSLPAPEGTTPIWALTAEDSPKRREALIAAGMDGILVKPLRMDAVDDVLRRVFRRSWQVHAHAGQTPPADSGRTARHAGMVFDPERLAQLDLALGRTSRDELMRMLVLDASTRPGIMRDHLEQGAIEPLRAEAHSLRGAALSLGAADLAAALRTLEATATGGPDDEQLMTAVERAAAEVAEAGSLSLQTPSA